MTIYYILAYVIPLLIIEFYVIPWNKAQNEDFDVAAMSIMALAWPAMFVLCAFLDCFLLSSKQ